MKDLIVDWNPWWAGKQRFQGIRRDKLSMLLPWIKRKEIVSIMGVRRSGKTTLLFEIIDHLITKENVNPLQILFIKADDDRAETGGLIDTALDEYEKLVNPQGKLFIFIDEIQEIKGWHKTLKRIYDLRADAKFFISGSNASILKEELGSLLAGRYASFELFPFTFAEFLHARNITFKDDLAVIQGRKKIQHFLLEYLRHGAFPEIVLEADVKIKAQLAHFYFDAIFYRDVIKRKKIRNAEKLEKLVKYYLQNISNLANFTKIGKLLELTTDSVGEYTRALEDAYLIFPVNILEFSYKKQVINPKKMYCVDIGIRNLIGFTFSDDLGRVYENAAFVHLRRRTKEIYYWTGKHECDFIVKDGKKFEAIQICYDLIHAKEREVQGLLEALEHFKLQEGIIITQDYEGEEKMMGKLVRFIPLWKWLLSV